VIAYLEGAFAIAIVDESERRVLLAVDRMGIERLTYSQRSGSIVFSNSSKAVAFSPGVRAGVRPQALYDYLLLHIVPAPETLEAIASTKGLNSEERMRANLLLAFTPEYVRTQVDEIDRIVHLRATNEVPEHIYLSQLQAAMSFDVESRLDQIKCETLVLSGDADVIVPVQNSRNLAERIRGARLEIIKGGSHTFFIEQAGEFNRLVTEFLATDHTDN
jgi:pimeloyl-ACP methyl ester carboxylesterase